MNQQKLANLMVGREVILQANKTPVEPGEEILRVEDLSVLDVDGIERLKKVGLSIRAGEIVGIAGVAGSGQQYLIKSIFGLAKAEPGSRVTYMGRDITNHTPWQNRLDRIGYIPQDRMNVGCNTKASIWENAIMGYHRATGFKPRWLVNHKQANAFTDQVVQDFDVKVQSREDRISSLSGGNIQKLIVGREFSQNNRLLLIEDPTRGIDVGAIEYIWDKLLAFAREGAAVLLVSHELNEVLQLSDRILVMYDGQLKDGGTHGPYTEEQIGLLMTGGDLE